MRQRLTGACRMSLIRLFTAIEGRIGLAPFWLGSIAVAVSLLLIERVAPQLAPFHAATIVAFAKAFALFPWAALAAKRAVDRGSAPLFGILLVCAIVLPGELKPAMSSAWMPSLDTISLIAWVVALVDLGLMPGARADDEAVAAPPVDAKPAA
jgi:uncharacterized membrane protein YhaH (DUF805 family)